MKQLSKTDLHMHTIYCDGKNTPEEMVQSAISKGFSCIGFSGHSFVPFDLACGMNAENESAYRMEIARLKEKYQGQIQILCGIEQDYFSETDPSDYDYRIGSVHYLKIPADQTGSDAIYISVDETPEILKQAVEQYFHGDFYLAAEQYFETVSHVAEQTQADIIGHFDLFAKFNEKEHFFDEHHPRYQAAWKKAVDRLLGTGIPFEINTGAISRGWRSVPYPHPSMITYIQEHGGRFLLSSDSHAKENIGFGFSGFSQYLTY